MIAAKIIITLPDRVAFERPIFCLFMNLCSYNPAISYRTAFHLIAIPARNRKADNTPSKKTVVGPALLVKLKSVAAALIAPIVDIVLPIAIIRWVSTYVTFSDKFRFSS